MMKPRTLGVIVAGGTSSRFGAPKALARVAGVRVVDRVAAALRATGVEVVAIVNDAALAEAIGLPHRADALADAGALAGVHAALLEARGTGCAGALVLGCDMPFVEAPLLREILTATAGADVVIPESGSRRGVEPLCAWYSTACVAAIERAIARGDARMIGFHGDVRVHRIPLERVAELGDPTRLFFNLNTPADLAEAERRA